MSDLPVIYRSLVRSEWIDRNRHFNAGYYMVAFDDALTGWFDYCGLTTDHRREHRVATFTVESHATYERELEEGAPLEISGQLLAWSDKKVHTFLRMSHATEGFLAATNEVMTLHIDMERRRPAPLAPEILARLEEIGASHLPLGRPPQSGRIISVDAKRPGRA